MAIAACATDHHARQRGFTDTLKVTLVVESEAPFSVTVDAPRPAAAGTGRWMTYSLRFHNPMDRPIQVRDVGGKGYWGPARKPILGLDAHGCGFNMTDGRAGFACVGSPDAAIPANGDIFGPVTLVRGTRGMGSLRPGTYVDEHTVTYRVEGTPEAQSRFRVIHEILRS